MGEAIDPFSHIEDPFGDIAGPFGDTVDPFDADSLTADQENTADPETVAVNGSQRPRLSRGQYGTDITRDNPSELEQSWNDPADIPMPLQYNPSLVVDSNNSKIGIIGSCLPLSPLSPPRLPRTPKLTPTKRSASKRPTCSLEGGTKIAIRVRKTQIKPTTLKLGMKLLGGAWARGWVFVASVSDNLAAAKAGILQGDAILEINGAVPLWDTAAQQLVEGRAKGLKLSILRGARVLMCKEGDREDQKLVMSAMDFINDSAEGKVTPLFAKAHTPPHPPTAPPPPATKRQEKDPKAPVR